MAGVGHLKGIWKDACRAAGAVLLQKTNECDVLGDQAGDFLRGVAFWSMRSLGFAKVILRDRRRTSYDLASLFLAAPVP